MQPRTSKPLRVALAGAGRGDRAVDGGLPRVVDAHRHGPGHLDIGERVGRGRLDRALAPEQRRPQQPGLGVLAGPAPLGGGALQRGLPPFVLGILPLQLLL